MKTNNQDYLDNQVVDDRCNLSVCIPLTPPDRLLGLLASHLLPDERNCILIDHRDRWYGGYGIRRFFDHSLSD
jgi:hypothetical protein